jgi:metal-responsive CopG/Arc/MetJ family transcriptional regulator
MRVKTSVTLPNDLLEQIDRAGSNRSTFLEHAARKALAEMEKQRRDAQDAAILNAHSQRLNREALKVLEYQDFD